MVIATSGLRETLSTAYGSAASWVSVHTSDPGATGAAELIGGSPAYARRQTIWTPGAPDGINTGSQVTIDVPAGLYTHMGLWTTQTGGVYRDSAPLGGGVTASTQDTIRITPTVIVDPASTKVASATFTGVGTLTAVMQPRVPVSATFTATGALTAVAQPRIAVTAPFTATGALTATAVGGSAGGTRAYGAASPPTTADLDAAAVSMGLEFYVPTTTTVTQIHFWQGTTNTDGSARSVGIYVVGTGTLVQAAETLTVSGVGWQTRTLTTPVPVTAGVRYKAVVYHPVGGYSATSAYYSTGAGSADLVTGALTVPNQTDATSPGQGTYGYATGISYPNSMFGSTNYWVDVTVAASSNIHAVTAAFTATGAFTATVSNAGTRAYSGATPPTTAAADDAPVTMGVEFYVAADSSITKIHFWQPATNADTSTRTVGICTVSGGTLIQSETLTVTGSGWQTKTLTNPVPVTAGVRYKAVVYHPAGRYVATSDYYSTGAGSTDLVAGTLTVPNQTNATAPGQGTYNYATGVSFPASMYASTNYWVDVTVEAGIAGGSNAPGTADPWGGTWPGPDNTGVPSGTTLIAYP